ncbi:EAL domain-containing response regulator [Labilithrix luteola]|uniref:EAL domain-containing response regulator n=1 Tax=Labilithrix luteola TaxID=1391654 RepID=UPI0014740C9F|nr:EAL domain-containing response regulator [Labilithrix luteola]
MADTLPRRTFDTVRFAAPRRAARTVLLVEDDELVARTLARTIRERGYDVVHVSDGRSAIESVTTRRFDVVFSDLNLPGASGVDILNVARAYDPDVPLVLMTGAPTTSTAIEACSLGVLEYLVKPTPTAELIRVLERAVATRKQVIAARTTEPSMNAVSSVTESMKALFDRALASLEISLEPIVDARTRALMGHAPKLTSNVETLNRDASITAAAEHLGRLVELRQLVRKRAVEVFLDLPKERQGSLFLDVHPSELLDGDLYAPVPPLSTIAEHVVLQLRVRGATLPVADLAARASVLRFVGYRLAIADLDVGLACLSQLGELSPEFVKLDHDIVRKLETSASQKRIVSALVAMCRAFDSQVVAEGVSTAEERDALFEAGCEYVQGALFAHASPHSGTRRVGEGSERVRRQP